MMRGMGNMQGMMKQMQKMQKQMKKDQTALEEREFTGQASDEMVTVKFNGKKELQDVQIKPEAVDPDDIEMLQDLIIMAVNNAMETIDQATQQTMGKYTNNLPKF